MTDTPLPDSVIAAGTGALHGCDNFQWADRTRFVTGIFLAMAKALVEHDRETRTDEKWTHSNWVKSGRLERMPMYHGMHREFFL